MGFFELSLKIQFKCFITFHNMSAAEIPYSLLVEVNFNSTPTVVSTQLKEQYRKKGIDRQEKIGLALYNVSVIAVIFSSVSVCAALNREDVQFDHSIVTLIRSNFKPLQPF